VISIANLPKKGISEIYLDNPLLNFNKSDIFVGISYNNTNMSVVYRISLKSKPDLWYIGSTKNKENRFKYHKSTLRKGKHHNENFQNAFNLSENKELVFEVLEDTTIENQFQREDFYIKLYGIENLYNIFDGAGTFGDILTHHPNKEKVVENIKNGVIKRYNESTDEEKVQRSENLKGDKNPNWKGGIVILCKCGNKMAYTANSCSDCRDRKGNKNPFFGKTHSKETIDKMLKNRKKIIPSNTLRVSVDNVIYESCTAASKAIGCTVATISNRANNSKTPNYFFIE
jgi:group I intron endonuclease